MFFVGPRKSLVAYHLIWDKKNKKKNLNLKVTHIIDFYVLDRLGMGCVVCFQQMLDVDVLAN